MAALQANPDDTATECQEKVTAVNEKINALASANNYSTGEINTAELLEKF